MVPWRGYCWSMIFDGRVGMLMLGSIGLWPRGEGDNGIHDKQRAQTSCFCQVRRLVPMYQPRLTQSPLVAQLVQ
jgi:hypothetical protein